MGVVIQPADCCCDHSMMMTNASHVGPELWLNAFSDRSCSQLGAENQMDVVARVGVGQSYRLLNGQCYNMHLSCAAPTALHSFNGFFFPGILPGLHWDTPPALQTPTAPRPSTSGTRSSVFATPQCQHRHVGSPAPAFPPVITSLYAGRN